MSRPMPDTPAPALSLPLSGGGTWTLNDPKPEHFTMVVFYRGYHCPVCKSYLQALKAVLPKYRDAGFDVIAVSMDDAERAAKTVSEWDLDGLPVGYGLTRAQAEAWGLYLTQAIRDTESAVFSEPGLFWVRADGRLYMAAVANMPWARPDLEFLASKIPFVLQNGYPARGTVS
ncbi:peroxiredoxin-like family protein [Aquabacter spiritensis]|uniref:Peroxiredoxin n=1 Tax=Aquabacter spiritensis TaxID=933073 RepID=A0A4R3LYC6_9HYPH|nr:peroxiredoxin-like family protein [Aquabacter spiritensis]TCT05680.1 peroxiredoxin [Aquabacter spiritensis]